MRRLITLISAGRNRIVMIRREQPRTRSAGWAGKPYHIEGWRILLSVNSGRVTRTVPSEPDVLCQDKACHSLLVEKSVGHRRRAQSRPSAVSRRATWTGGGDATETKKREWQAWTSLGYVALDSKLGFGLNGDGPDEPQQL